MADRRWVRLALRGALRFWPADLRQRDGDALVGTAAELVGEAFERSTLAGLRATLGEVGALAREGIAMRGTRGRHSVDEMRAGWWGDVRYAVRTLRRRPGFAAVAVATVALGIGANAAVFEQVDELLLQGPPYRDADDLVLVWQRLAGSAERVPVSGPDAAALDAGSGALADIGFALRPVDGSLAVGAGAPEHVQLSAVSEGFFDLLGTEARLGRTFTPDDGRSAEPAVLLSHLAWRRHFASDPDVVGATVRLNGFQASVVGVMPADFRLEVPPEAGVGADVDLWIPLSVPLDALHRDERLLDRDSDNTGILVGRLATGRTLAEAQAEADRVAADLRAVVPSYAAAGLELDVRALRAEASEHRRRVLWPLGVGVTVVLLAACLNLATLALARGVERRDELAVRSALGAARGRLVRQLFVEGAVPVAIGTGVAVLVAAWAGKILQGVAPAALRSSAPATGPAWIWTVLLGLGCAALCALGPALRLGRSAAGGALPGRGGGSAHGRLRSGLVVTQVALSLALVLGSSLLLRTVTVLGSEHPGFQPEGALTFQLSLRVPDDYRSPAVRARLMSDIARGLEARPDVRAAGLIGVLPLSGERWTQPYGLPGQSPDEWSENRADFRAVTSGAFAALGTRVIEGRSFTAREDVAEDERVVVIDRNLARRIAPEGSAVGLSLGFPLDGAAAEARIVGVVEPIRYDAIDTPAREAVYVPYRQEASRDVAFVVRSEGDPAALAPAVREVVRSVDPRIPVHAVRTLDDYVAESLSSRTFALAALLGFAGLGLLCAGVGLYGVVAWDVRRRTRDLGLRMAVGARRRDVLLSVLGRGARLTGLGLVVGALPAWAAARALEGLLLDGASQGIPLAIASGGVVLVVTLLACLAPAVRAARLDPTTALSQSSLS